MKTMLLLQSAAITAMLLFLLPLPTSSAEINHWPSQVKDTLEDMGQVCMGDVPYIEKDLDPRTVRIIDLNHDGHPDYVINDKYFPTPNDFLTCRHGMHGGEEIIIFASLPDGTLIKAYDQTVWHSKYLTTQKVTLLWVEVSGHNCGQQGDFSFADMIYCERRLLWNKESRSFEMAPLSEAIFKNSDHK